MIIQNINQYDAIIAQAWTTLSFLDTCRLMKNIMPRVMNIVQAVTLTFPLWFGPVLRGNAKGQASQTLLF